MTPPEILGLSLHCPIWITPTTFKPLSHQTHGLKMGIRPVTRKEKNGNWTGRTTDVHEEA